MRRGAASRAPAAARPVASAAGAGGVVTGAGATGAGAGAGGGGGGGGGVVTRMPRSVPSLALPLPGEPSASAKSAHVDGLVPPLNFGAPTIAFAPDLLDEGSNRLLVTVQLTHSADGTYSEPLIRTLSRAAEFLLGGDPSLASRSTSMFLTTLWANTVPVWVPSWMAGRYCRPMKTLSVTCSLLPPSGAMIDT